MSHLFYRAARRTTLHKGPRYFTRMPTRIEKVHILNEHYNFGVKVFHWGMGLGNVRSQALWSSQQTATVNNDTISKADFPKF